MSDAEQAKQCLMRLYLQGLAITQHKFRWDKIERHQNDFTNMKHMLLPRIVIGRVYMNFRKYLQK